MAKVVQTPRTFVAFCSNLIIRPCLEEFREITLEFREWCERIVAFLCSMHGDDVIFWEFMFLISLEFMVLLWCRSVTERRSGDELANDDLLGVCNKDVLAFPPTLEPRL